MFNSPTVIKLTKEKLQQLINQLMNKKVWMHWRYDDPYIFLILDAHDVIDELKFKKENNILCLDTDSIFTMKNTDIKFEIINFLGLTDKAVIDEKLNIIKSKKHLQLEIDYHLLELHDYIQQNNKVMVEAVKNILLGLTNQLKSIER